MIKASELRIGNWVKSLTHGNSFKTTALDILEFSEDLGIASSYDPISLTREILETCGFENTEKTFTKSFRKKDVVISQSLGVPEQFTFGYYREHGRVGTTAIAFKYLHDLQNLYFSLTGEELEVMLNNEQEVQECDASKDATTTEAGNQNKTSNSEATILSAEEVLEKHFKSPEFFKVIGCYDKIVAAMEEYKNQEVQLLNK